MHFCGPDQKHGYDRRLVGDILHSYAGGPDIDWHPHERCASNIRRAYTMAGPGDSMVLRYDEDVTRGFEAFVERRAAGPSVKPLFVTVGYYGPHCPFTAPPEHYEKARSLARRAGEVLLAPQPDDHPFLRDLVRQQRGDEASPEQVEQVRLNYAGMVMYLDGLVGRVLSAAARLPGETLVIYTSDHGEMLGERLLFGKTVFFEASSRVPLVFSPLRDAADAACGVVAGAAAAGGADGARSMRRVPVPALLSDLASTLPALTGGPALPEIDGIDLSAMTGSGAVDLRSGGASFDTARYERPILSEIRLPNVRAACMLRRGDWKLFYYHGYHACQLYNIKQDPLEQRDLGSDGEHESLRRELLSEMMSRWSPERVERTYEQRERETGYLRRWGREVGMGPMQLWTPGEWDREW
jgi:choline-sulfatase